MDLMPKRGSVTHVVYDVDGLLIDSERYYLEAYKQIAARYGKVFDWSLKSKTIGRRAEESARIITQALDLPLTPDQWLEIRKSLLEELFPLSEPMPGALRLTRHFHQNRVPQGIATSSDRRYFDIKTRRHKAWFAIFDCFISGDDPAVHRGKPAPDIFLECAIRMNVEPARCLVFEDSPAGVEAARAAGMYAIAVPDPCMESSAYPGAHQILRSLEEFRPREWDLPGFID
jgi:beta-phosphoglucomutase-like phosphatase (HAD superfamily)